MSADDRRARRLAENEALAREVNEHVGDVAAAWYAEDEQLEFMCECSLPDCQERIRLRMAEYAHVRSSPHWFVMVPDHLLAEIEREVERIGDHVVVEKIGAGRDVAERTA
jgi:hypothetical protein